MVPAVLAILVALPEDGLAAVVLAVEVLQVLDGAALEPAALAGIEVKHVVVPGIVRGLIKKLNYFQDLQRWGLNPRLLTISKLTLQSPYKTK